VPRRCGMEDKSQGIRPGGNSGQGVFQAGYAADFYFNHGEPQEKVKVKVENF